MHAMQKGINIIDLKATKTDAPIEISKSQLLDT